MTGKSLSSPPGATSPRGVTEAAVLEVCSSGLLLLMGAEPVSPGP